MPDWIDLRLQNRILRTHHAASSRVCAALNSAGHALHEVRFNKQLRLPTASLLDAEDAEELHYSPHSRDREVARRQQLRANGGGYDDYDAGPGSRRPCCVVS